MGATLDGIDLVNPDNYVERVPFEWFDRPARANDPVSWHAEPAGTRGSGRSPATTTSPPSTWTGRRSRRRRARSRSRSSTPNSSRSARRCSRRIRRATPSSARSARRSSPPAASASYEDFIRDVARSVLDQALRGGEFDFVSEISRELPIRFLCSIFTVPQEDAPELIRWGDKMIANQDPELSAAVADQVDTEAYRLLPFRSPAALEVFAYADRQKRAPSARAHRRRDLRRSRSRRTRAS